MSEGVQLTQVNVSGQDDSLSETLVAQSHEGKKNSRDLVILCEDGKVTEYLRKTRYRQTHLAQVGSCVTGCNLTCGASWSVYSLFQAAFAFSTFNPYSTVGFISISAVNAFVIQFFSYLSKITCTGRPIALRDTCCYDLSKEGAKTDCCGKINCSPLMFLAWTPVILSIIFGLGSAGQAAAEKKSDQEITFLQGVASACFLYMIPNILFAIFACMSDSNLSDENVLLVDKKDK
ncbi:MAG: hypothetical protein S4CHLAM20_13550 [Chlamydiia bacterium]|nr:hypothetical protein [Chlamydiia bacterium]